MTFMLVATRLRHIAGTKWGMSQYLKIDRLKDGTAKSIEAQPGRGCYGKYEKTLTVSIPARIPGNDTITAKS